MSKRSETRVTVATFTPRASVALGLLVVAIGTVALGLVACVGDSPVSQPQTDAGTQPDVAPGSDASPDDAAQDATSAPDTGPPPTCGVTPTLHPGPAGTIYCSSSLNCATGQQCCLGGAIDGGFAANSCGGFNQVCSNPPGGGLPVECVQASDCTANGLSGNVCCLRGSTLYSGCTFPLHQGGTGIFCEAPASGYSCASGEVQICTSSNDCPQGKTCTPGKWKLLQWGFCN